MSDLDFKARVPVFDANIGVGHRHDRPSPFVDAGGLRAEMDRHGVDRALVYHLQGESISAIEGNEALAGWSDEALVPQYVANSADETLEQLRQYHAATPLNSIRLHHTADSLLPFVDWIYGNLLEWLTTERIPLWISLADTPLAEIADALCAFPDLHTVLLGAHYTHTLALRPLLDLLPAAHLELSRYENLGAVEALIADYGAKRFLYGSFYPRLAMGPMLYYLHHIGLDDDALRSVCAGNLQRLLGEES